MGPEIGDAYIEVHASTRRLAAEIRREAKVAGKEWGDSFSDGVDDQLDSRLSAVGVRLRQKLSAKEEGRTAGADFGKALMDSIDRQITKYDFDLAEAVTGGNWDKVLSNFDDLDTSIEKATSRMKQLSRESGGLFGGGDLASATRSMGEFADSLRVAAAHEKSITDETRAQRDHSIRLVDLSRELSNMAATRAEAEYLASRNADMFEAAMRRSADWSAMLSKASTAENETLSGRRGLWDRILAKMQTAVERQTVLVGVDEADMGPMAYGWNKVVEAMTDVIAKLRVIRDKQVTLNADTETTHRGWRKIATAMDDASTKYSLLGRLAGSRNDFFNIIGRSGQFVETLLSKIMSLAMDLPAQLTKLGDAIGARGGGISGFLQLLGEGDWVTLLVKAGVVIYALGQGVVFTATAVGGLVGAAINLGGIVYALIGSLGFGLMGALLPLAPMLVAVAGGAGAAITAFAGLGDELDATIQPLKDWFAPVRDAVRANIFPNLSGQVERFLELLGGFSSDLLTNSAESLSTVIDNFLQAFDSPDVQSTLASLSESLPGILTNLGTGLGTLTTGLLGFFEGLAPYAEDLSADFANMTQSFSIWANSAEGQNSIADFMDRAWTSASLLWGLVVSLTTAISDFFSQGKGTGDGFLVSITAIVDEFDRWVNSPEGREAISSWMERASALASGLWTFIVWVGAAIDALDTPNTRAALDMVGRAFSVIGEHVLNVIRGVDTLTTKLAGIGSAISGGISTAISWLGRLFDSIKRAFSVPLPSWMGGFANRPMIPGAAMGTLAMGPQVRLIGEAGPEAVVPLNRPLSMVDPSVRWLSAIAQGHTPMAAGGVVGGGKSITVMPGAIVATMTSADPYQVANSILDRFVAQAN